MSRRHKAPPTEIFTATITDFSHEGRGMATVDHKKVFISNALPSETVEFKYTSMHSRYDEGRSTAILNAAPERVTPECPHFTICGGCSLQHISTAAQLALKEKTLLEQFQHFAKTNVTHILPAITGPIYRYRRKARLGVRYVAKKGGVLVGFREEQSRYLADINHCVILHPPMDKLIDPLRELLAQLSIFEEIAQIEVAMGDTDTALLFRNLAPLTETDKALLSAFGQQHQLMIFLQPNKPEKLTKLYPGDGNEFLSYRHPDFDLTLWFHPTDFTQINLDINRQMVKQALNHLDLQTSDTVLDLFSGLGNFTLPISRSVKQVIGIEGSSEMTARAIMNAQRNQITNAEFFTADLSKPLLVTLPTADWVTRRYDKLLLDPARSGAEEVLQYIPQWSPRIIVYISCNPATLARDTQMLGSLGYDLLQAGIIDMFPQTNHVESMAVFRRR